MRWVHGLEDADRLTEGAANALLKVVEEPPPSTVFLLCAPSVDPEDIAITVHSHPTLSETVKEAALAVDGRWHAVARGVLRDELAAQQRTIVGQVLEMPGDDAQDRVDHWVGRDDPALGFTLAMLTELAAQKTLDYPTASVAVQRLSQLAQRG